MGEDTLRLKLRQRSESGVRLKRLPRGYVVRTGKHGEALAEGRTGAMGTSELVERFTVGEDYILDGCLSAPTVSPASRTPVCSPASAF